jgi:NAD(P)-dependent dehydrogenase (short-subunit alcohol dehydrogenase family)
MNFRTSFSISPAQIISVATTKVNHHGAGQRIARSGYEPKTFETRRRPMKLSNKIAVVTGGTSGIGLEAAKLFRDEGATVIVVGQNQARLESAASQLGDNVTSLRGDVSKPADIENIISQIRDKYGRIDVLYANAGIGVAAPLEAVTEDQIDTQFGVNFKGVFFTIQKAAPLLSKGASIVVTTSFLNEVGTPGLSILSATKAAVRSLVRSFGAELAPRGIRVNAVSPGPISTPFHGKLGLSEKQLDETASAIEDQVPLHRFGEAGEIAKAALFLATDDSSFMTGSELVVDGGITQL